MRIIVMSDSHMNRFAVEDIVSRNLDADMFIHLGDGESDVNYVIAKYPGIAEKFYHVRGNCDYDSSSPDVLTLNVLGHRIFASHGHIQGVKFTLDNFIQAAKNENCDIALYGHTHISCNSFIDGMYIMNPGSAAIPGDESKPSFGCIDISEAGVLTNIATI